MKITVFTLLFLFVFTIQGRAQLSGTYTVGSGGDYDSLSAAVAALNAAGVSGPVVLSMLNGTHDLYTNIALGCSGTSSTNTITIKPAGGATVTVNFLDGSTSANINGHFVIGSPTAAASNRVSTNYLTIDGSNNGSASKDMTINGPTTSSSRSVFRIYGDNDNITLKNCIITCNSSGTSAHAAIELTPHTTNGLNPDNITISRNTITATSGTASVGILASGSGTTTGGSNLVIEHNSISANHRGMVITFTLNADIYGNTLSVNSTGTTSNMNAFGITMQSNFSSSGVFNLYNNRFTSLTTSMSGSPAGSNGIIAIDNQNLTPHTVNIYNNFIGGFQTTATTNNARIYGIRLAGTCTTYVYHNTISIPQLNDMTSNNNIAGIAFAAVLLTETSPTGTAVVKNNIIAADETGMTVYGIRRIGTGGTFSSDYNNIHIEEANTQGYIGLDNATGYLSLTDWINSTAYDDHSKNADVVFTSDSDLHLSGASLGDGNLIGTTGLGISTDIDGDSRSVTIPYMGADEGSEILPVEMTFFRAVPSGNTVLLQWGTASETDNYGFEIERSDADLRGWSKIGFVAGSGTTNIGRQYEFADARSSGRTLYRLKQIDRSGAFRYSASIESAGSGIPRFSLEQNYPNPFNPETVIRFELSGDGPAVLTVYSVLGQRLAVLADGMMHAGTHSVHFNGKDLAAGTYLIELRSGTNRQVRRMTLLR